MHISLFYICICLFFESIQTHVKIRMMSVLPLSLLYIECDTHLQNVSFQTTYKHKTEIDNKLCVIESI